MLVLVKRKLFYIYISDTIEFRPRKLFRDKEGNDIMIKWSIPREDIIIFNMYAPNNRALKYVRPELIELEGEINKSSIIVGDVKHLSLSNS